MTDRQRIADSTAFVLHRRGFRDTSQIVEFFSRDQGRVALVARGVRAGRSKLRGVLQPFTPVSIAWTARGELGTLASAEAVSAQIWLRGDLLHAGFYLNELILKLLQKGDAQPEIFDLYTDTLTALARSVARPDAVLRRFEMTLLDLLGYGVQLDRDVASGQRLEDDYWYRVRPDAGPMRVGSEDGELTFAGATLKAVSAGRYDDPMVLRATRRIAHAAISLHLDGRVLKSRAVMREIADHRMKESSES